MLAMGTISKTVATSPNLDDVSIIRAGLGHDADLRCIRADMRVDPFALLRL